MIKYRNIIKILKTIINKNFEENLHKNLTFYKS